MALLSRKLHIFQKATCDVPDLYTPASEPLFGDMYFSKFSKILSGAFAGAACLITLFTIMRHATRFSNPKEQKHIIRILFMAPVFALLTFGTLFVKENAIYLISVNTLYESLALTSLFLLLCCYIDNSEDERAIYFLNLPAWKGTSYGGCLPWYNKCWTLVFQYFPLRLIITIIAMVTQATGVYCTWSRSIHFAHLWLTIIGTASAIIAILAIIKFYLRLKTQLGPHKPLLKITAAKLIVGLSIIQGWIFSFILSRNIVKPTATLSYSDQSISIPVLITCIESFLFALLFLFAFPSNVYSLKRTAYRSSDAQYQGSQHYEGGFLGVKAILAAMNIMDIVRGVLRAISLVAGGSGRGAGMGEQQASYGYGGQGQARKPVTRISSDEVRR